MKKGILREEARKFKKYLELQCSVGEGFKNEQQKRFKINLLGSECSLSLRPALQKTGSS